MSLEIKNLTFSYKSLPLCRRDAKEEKQVLKDFSASFEPGIITAITGENGCGKTTLARLIMGILTPDAGTINVDGKDISSWSLAERGMAIGYAMQNPSKQIFNESVLEEVMFGLKNHKLTEEEARRIALGYIDMFGLSEHISDSPFILSHGEKQRLVLASIIAMKPGYLILDEPSASLDEKHKDILGNLLLRIARPGEDNKCSGCGVLVISHDRSFIKQFCDEEISLNA